MAILSPVACNIWFEVFLLFRFFFFLSRAQSAPPHCPGGSSIQSTFKHWLFDLQNSLQKSLIFTFPDFFFSYIDLEPIQMHVLSLGFVGSRPTARELEDFGGEHLLDVLTVVCALRA